jgi:hypothetical protein
MWRVVNYAPGVLGYTAGGGLRWTLMVDQVQILVGFDDEEDFDLLQEAVAEEGDVEAKRPQGIAPVLAALLIAAGIAPVLGVLGKWLGKQKAAGKQKAGIVVDARKEGEDRVAVDKDLEYGQMVIITTAEDGKTVKVEVTTYDPDNDFSTLSKLIWGKIAEGAGKSIGAIGDAVKGVVGSKGDVKVAELPAG